MRDGESGAAEARAVARAIESIVTHARRQVNEAIFEDEATFGSDNESDHPYGLSPRELEAMTLAWRGMSDKQIAFKMGISRFTVAKHIGGAMRKLNVETRTQASVIFERESLYKVVS
jgi:DNA-binding NarL/FixJ family response regulator